ncbi:outer membrane protein [Fodinibius salinus]|uniref:Outer membrane protein n=1 Tax=Fodinibius salinus TaxID=860790 RepID=A0A5D3YJW5_9BACT|nr:TolC family protein [Fodinibius salinus]TYP92022.1 outer membrane protein [Fodinibius salinus]
MKNKTIVTTFVLVIITAVTAAGQSNPAQADTLSLSQAVGLALEKNHNITIARNRAEIDENNATLGNAGYLPSLTANGSYRKSIENTTLNFSGNTPDTSRTGSISSQLAGSLNAQYTLFDGFGNAYRLKSLKRQAKLGSVQSRLEIENTLLQVIQRYLQTIARAELATINRQSIDISEQRFKRAQKQYQMGGRTKVNLLNAEVALNQDSIRYVQSNADLQDAKRNLLVLLGEQPSGDIHVQKQISINRELNLQELMQSALQNNASLVTSELETKLAEVSLKQSRSDRYPQLNAEASYNYTRSQSEANLLSFQETNGLTGTLSLSFNIFNGFQRKIDIQNAKIRLRNSKEQQQLAQKQLRRDMRNAYEDYSTNIFLLDKQQLNVQTAELNFRRTQKAFKLGQVSNTEFREAQLNLLQARQELVNLKVNAKLSEIELLKLGGRLLEIE